MLPAATVSSIRIGATTVTYLPDGHARLVPGALFPASQPNGWARHAPYLDDDVRLTVSIGSFLVQTPRHRVLIDLGIGAVEFDVPDIAEFRGGELLESLRGVGLDPGDIDVVAFTHLHHDHVGWTSTGAPAPSRPSPQDVALTFGRARHLVARPEWTHWFGSDEITGPDPVLVQAPLEPIIEFITVGEEFVPGIRAVSTAGHTPGHLSCEITDPASSVQVLVLGDVMHTQAQIAETDWNFLFDVDPERGIATRRALLNSLDDERTVVVGGHFAGQVFGRVLSPVSAHRWSAGVHPSTIGTASATDALDAHLDAAG
ncbi:MBL fold metallo-hydrolase [Gordonia soli]|uniref:Putative hydrolase n=1 Tax=Gordonia soli NBRC 108243 TaxID=1223545 RepID=M0QP90_9ACTN|nr:MBL fold metallo-hydrolase [Gordonia soli]GAC70229.1 putative hydrolase [Gordonia soli NBRC 108243]